MADLKRWASKITMSLTKQEYDRMIVRREAGQIRFMFDPTQCKDFLLNLDNVRAESTLGNSLRFESRVVRIIAHIVEPVALLLAITGAFVWLGWWGLLIGPAVFVLWGILKSISAVGRQRIVGPLFIFVIGLVAAFVFREQGLGFVLFSIAMSVLYLAAKFLYALPVWFFSDLIRANYELVNLVFSTPVDDFNRKLGIPLMWHVETPDGKLPPLPTAIDRLFLTIYGLCNEECRTRIRKSFDENGPTRRQS